MEDAARYKFLRNEDDWGEDGEVDSWACLGELTEGEFDALVDRRRLK